MVIVHSQFVFGPPANAILSTSASVSSDLKALYKSVIIIIYYYYTVLSVYAVNRTLSQHSTLCILTD